MDIKTSYDDNGQIKHKVTSNKFGHYFEVRKTVGGFSFYEVGVSKGNPPNVLSGRYTTPEKALKAVQEYIRTSKGTPIAARNRKTAIREKHKKEEALAAAVQSDNKEHVQQGTAH